MDKEIRPFTYLAPESQIIVYGEDALREMAHKNRVLKRLEEAQKAKERLFEKPEPKTKPQQLNLDV